MSDEQLKENDPHQQPEAADSDGDMTVEDNTPPIAEDQEAFAAAEGHGEDPAGSLQDEIAELKDALLRQKAETENVRRRGEKDKADASAYAVTRFARDILTVADNLKRALDSLPETLGDDVQAFADGVSMTERELQNTLSGHGIVLVEPEIGEKFDPNAHQAMFEVPSNDHPTGTIVQVVAAGYRIKDRLLRPAMVGVAKAEGEAPKVDTQA